MHLLGEGNVWVFREIKIIRCSGYAFFFLYLVGKNNEERKRAVEVSVLWAWFKKGYRFKPSTFKKQ